MSSVNKVILIGNLGKDPEIRYTAENVAVANFPIATTETYKDRNGNKQEQTEWHNIVVWRQLAEIAEKYLRKGRQVYVEGKLKTRSWDDKDGNKRYTTEIVADSFTMLGRKEDDEGGSDNRRSDHGGNSDQGGDAAKPQSQQGSVNDVQIDDDLPF